MKREELQILLKSVDEKATRGDLVSLLTRAAQYGLIDREQFEETQNSCKGRIGKDIKSLDWTVITDSEPEVDQDSKTTKENENIVSLVQTLRHSVNLPTNEKDSFMTKVEEIVGSVSRMLRRGSLLVLVHFTRMLQENKPLREWTDTHWRHALLVGTDNFVTCKDTDTDYDFFETYKSFASKFPTTGIYRYAGDSQIVTYAAKQLATMWSNNLWMPIIVRLKRVCKQWLLHTSDDLTRSPSVRAKFVLSTAKKPKKPVTLKLRTTMTAAPSPLELVRAIEHGVVDPDMSDACKEFVREMRSRIGLHDTLGANGKLKSQQMTDSWAKKKSNRLNLMTFNYWMQKSFAAWNTKGIKLCPVFSVRRQHIQFDTSAMLSILESCDICCPTTKNSEDWISEVFTLPKRTISNKCSGNGLVMREWKKSFKTDGISSSFALKKTDHDQISPTNDKPAQHLAHKKITVVGIDPGVHNSVYAAARYMDKNGEERVFERVLTRKMYYQLSGIEAATRRSNGWFGDMRPVWQKLSTDGNLKSPDVNKITDYLDVYNAAAQKWWDSALQKKHSKQRFRTNAGRKRVLDLWFCKLKRDVQALDPTAHVVVAYGAATFSPSGKGRATTPTTALYKACFRHLQTFKQNECRTSRQHNVCLGDVSSCWRTCVLDLHVGEDGKICADVTPCVRHGAVVPKDAEYLRGLQYCSQCDRFLNRDRNSALAIAKVFFITQVLCEPTPEAFIARRKHPQSEKSACSHEHKTASALTSYTQEAKDMGANSAVP